MKKLFLISYTIEYTPYMEKTKTSHAHHIVWAEDQYEAEHILEEYITLKSEPNGDSYWANVISCTEALDTP